MAPCDRLGFVKPPVEPHDLYVEGSIKGEEILALPYAFAGAGRVDPGHVLQCGPGTASQKRGW